MNVSRINVAGEDVRSIFASTSVPALIDLLLISYLLANVRVEGTISA